MALWVQRSAFHGRRCCHRLTEPPFHVLLYLIHTALGYCALKTVHPKADTSKPYIPKLYNPTPAGQDALGAVLPGSQTELHS